MTILLVVVVLVSGCAEPQANVEEAVQFENTVSNAESTAQKFAVELQNQNYSKLYDLFTPELKSKRNKNNLVAYITKKGSLLGSTNWFFDKVVVSDNDAYAYYTVSSGILESKIPPVHLIYTSEGWRVDAFAPYFTEGCFGSFDCSEDKPVCTTDYECIGCIEDSDCKDEQKQYCFNGNCEECVEDSNCKSEEKVYYSILNEKAYCLYNECVECKKDNNCPSNKPFCIYTICEENKSCQDRSDCPYNHHPYCLNGFCSQYMCKEDSDCSLEYYCLNGFCKKCKEDSDCSEYSYFRYCLNGDCSSNQCENNSDCPSNKPFCIDSDVCAECMNDSDCPSNEPICFEDVCNECRSNSDCINDTYICKFQSCMECECKKNIDECMDCRITPDCGEGYDCKYGTCCKS